ncbi:MAG: hypothetical protein ACLFPE_00790 [Bacteroidales bacterium]
MTRKNLIDIEHLVYKSKFMNEFHEEELQQSLDPFFEKPALLSNQYYNDVIRLLYMISGIDKSSNFGYYFYEKMQENPYPFCEEILQAATYTEAYYNLHDKALKSYVRSHLINSLVPAADILVFDKIIPEGHGKHFFESLRLISEHHINLIHPVSPDFFKSLFYILNNDSFPMSQKKASCIVAYLNIEIMVPPMIGKAIYLLNLPCSDTEHILVMLHYLKSVSMILCEKLPAKIEKQINALLQSKRNEDMMSGFLKARKDLSLYLDDQDKKLYSVS